MRDKTTYISVDRNILEWRWFKDSKTFHVFMFLILKANIKENDFENAKVERGEIATSYASIAAQTGLTYSEVRGAVTRLKRSGEITVRKHSKFVVISIANYSYYQEPNRQNARKKQPLDNHSTTTQQQSNNITMENKGNNNARARATRPAYATMEDIDELINELDEEAENDKPRN